MLSAQNDFWLLGTDYILDVNGDARIGWHGHSDKIMLSPNDLLPKTVDVLGTTGSAKYYGTYANFDDVDGIISFFIPVGYQMTGCTLYFSNEPNDVRVYEHDISGTTQIQRGVNNSPTATVNLSLSTSIQGGSTKYVTIQIENDSTKEFSFTGGFATIIRQ